MPETRSTPASSNCLTAVMGVVPGSTDFDTPRCRVHRPGARNGQHAVAQIGRHRRFVDGMRKMEGADEGAVATLDPVILLASRGAFAPAARDRQPAVVQLDVDVVAFQTWKLRDHDVAIGGF